ncbi:PIG-L family deacetylase [Brucella sp. BO2]|uniref:PIG-L deacetylase family protein n=1 Tax=Brucella sp. BO2 TaxID=693750 RepID=UPI0018CA29C8|nr:PIG-L family deacetylase [Brucella sp. BO2]QPN26928.1 PIG-L family deacetylase [Brucella sp. BO2]
MIETVIFLFPHQDDEFGVFKQIRVEVERGRRVVCAYLTTGVSEGESSVTRNMESLKVLKKLGVLEHDILFPGAEYSIADKQLMYNLDRISGWIEDWISSVENLRQVYVPSWEGGHPDHDALHGLIVRQLARARRIEIIRQFSLYNAYRCSKPFYRVLKPIINNGAADSVRITFRERILFNKLVITGFPSQRRSWLGLYPFFLAHYLFNGSQQLQNVSVERTYERPHDGNLYYENRNFATFESVIEQLNRWEESSR